MDPYDAILEQLKRAQTRGLETVTNRLDFVVETLEELIQEAKSSVQEAIPREPDELFPLAEVEPLVGQLREQRQAAEERAEGLTAQLADLRQQVEDGHRRAEEAAQAAAAAAAAAAVAEAQLRVQPVVEAPPALGVSLDLFRRLDLARSQSELLRELLPALSDFVGRAVVLVMRGRTVSAWSGIGFEDPDRLRGWKGEADESAAFTRLADDAVPIRCNAATDPLLSRWLAGEPVAEEVLLVPVCLRGKIMGGLYVDRVEGRPWEPDQAQTLVALTCWLIDTLTYRQTVPSAMLADPLDLRGEPEEAAAVEVEAEAEAEAWVAEPEEVEPAVAAAEPVEEAEPEPAAEFDARSTVRVELGAIPVVAPPAPEPVPEPVPEPEPEPEPVVPVVEAPPEPRPLTAEEQARHEEARRFARLLVSEIKLYNEEEVERGRVNKDLYHRLKDDFDRSKEMYEKRISPEIRGARDYFYEELLRILADGDPDALGM